jgi:hypothetical protein
MSESTILTQDKPMITLNRAENSQGRHDSSHLMRFILLPPFQGRKFDDDNATYILQNIYY